MLNALRPDGSLMVICEVEYLPPGAKQSVEHTDVDTCYEDPAANAEAIVTKTLRDMWQSELFSDVILKVGPSKAAVRGDSTTLVRYRSETSRSPHIGA